MGRLSDIFGRRYFFIGGNLIGLISSILGATAQNIPTLVASSALAGLAASVQLSFPIVIGELIPNKYRAIANGFILATAIPFSVFGPVVARSFILHTAQKWRWSYYLNIIMSGIVVILYTLFYHPPTYKMLHARRGKKMNVWAAIDIGGCILFSLALVLFLLGMSWGGQRYPWKSAHVIGTLVGGVAGFVAFVLYGMSLINFLMVYSMLLTTNNTVSQLELYIPLDYPFIPLKLFKNFAYVNTVLVGAVGSMIYYSMNVLWPTEVSKLYETGLLQIGWLSMTVGGGTLAGQYLGSWLCQPLGKHKWQLIICSCAMTGLIGAMAAATPDTQAFATAMTTLGSVAVGYIELVVLTTAPLCLAPEDLGLATGVGGTVRAGCGAIATAIYVTILNNKVATNVPKYVGPAAVEAGLPKSSLPSLYKGLSSGNLTAVPDLTPKIQSAAGYAYKVAYGKSFQVVYLASLAFGVLSIATSILTPNLEKQFNTDVARKLHGKDINTVEARTGHDVDLVAKNVDVSHVEEAQ